MTTRRSTPAPPRKAGAARRPSGAGRWVLALCLMVLLGGLSFYVGWRQAVLGAGRPDLAGALPAAPPAVAPGADEGPPEAVAEAPPEEASEQAPPEAPREEPPAPAESPAPAPVRARVAIVIDDCGNNWERDQGFVEMDEPVTLAVLPHLPHTRRVAEAAAARGRCVLLHLPMETLDGRDPGPGTLRTDMDDETLARTVDEDFDALPEAVGVNNHEGSRGSADPRLAGAAVAEARQRGLFVLDSRTTADTLLAPLALEEGVPVLSRDVFLDNEDDVDRILEGLELLGRVALRDGTAVAIGHPRPRTLEALRLGLPRLAEQGISVVPLPELVAGSSAPPR